ncbi:hypothetical protein FNL39_103744 [Nocardia caishijiensis]|uniref:Uncharacterized protein n=1 Tax=Nocardia caishijiensis TaxID=184756 RepID=A0ABQ6YPV9_9NOCA|nr:hypothetical protein FNL39_103744 [Nocardia caishijiensis]
MRAWRGHTLRQQHARELTQGRGQFSRRTTPAACAQADLELGLRTARLSRPAPLLSRCRRSEVVHRNTDLNRDRNQQPLRNLPGSQNRRFTAGTRSLHRHAAFGRTSRTATYHRTPPIEASRGPGADSGTRPTRSMISDVASYRPTHPTGPRFVGADTSRRCADNRSPGGVVPAVGTDLPTDGAATTWPWRDRHHDHPGIGGHGRDSFARRWRRDRHRSGDRRPRRRKNHLPMARWLREYRPRAHRARVPGGRCRDPHRAEEGEGDDQDARRCVHGINCRARDPGAGQRFPECGQRRHMWISRISAPKFPVDERGDFGLGPAPRRLNKRFVLSSNTCARHGPTSRATRARPSGRRSQRGRSERACQREFSSG